jgi:hypothetical protein
MASSQCPKDYVDLSAAAVRMLKASALGKAPQDEDMRRVQSAAGPEERGLPADELACQNLLREVLKRRQATLAPAIA